MYRSIGLLFCSLFGLCGCGNSDPFNRQPVSGMVTIDGRPIPYGNIEFVPVEGQPTGVTADIREGKFTIDKRGGLAPGNYLVRFQGMDALPPPPGDVPGTSTGPQPKKIIPDKYGPLSKETANIKAGAANELTFPLKN